MNSPFSRNPIDTVSQREFELRALEVFQHPDFQQAKSEVEKYWLEEVKPSDDALSCFDGAFEEVCFGATIWSLNQDPLHPAVITISRVEHFIDGVRIPGSRWGIDNPDSVYRVIPISGEHSYRISGRVAAQRLTENYFTLWDDRMATVGVLSGKDLQLDKHGRFEISVDAMPANGRLNHIQSAANAHQFYIRDVLQNWHEECVNELSIELLDGDGPAPERDFDQDLKRAIKYMWDYTRNTTRWNRQATDKPVNAFDFKIDRDVDGALRNQIYIMGQFKLEQGQAMLIDVDLGGAEYFIAPITNLWGTSNQIIAQNGSLNLSQSVGNQDGSYTFVVSVEDPGVHNWLNPDGMHEGILTLRWAEFANGRPEDSLQAKAKIVNLLDIAQHLPVSLPIVSEAERQQQHAARAESYAWRIAESM
ncbi:MAG: hypothetical protein AAF542_13090 [Pseudomonadota bacterium]